MAQNSSKTNALGDDLLCMMVYLHRKESVFEIRAFVGGRVHSGYFNDRRKAMEEATAMTKYEKCSAVYITLNSCAVSLLARAENRTKQCWHKDPTTADKDVAALSTLLIDIDPERPSGISSSNREHDAALIFAQRLRKDLLAQGWPEPLVGDSGNGAHLLFKLPNLPNTPEYVDLVKRVLKGLHMHYASEEGRGKLIIDCCNAHYFV